MSRAIGWFTLLCIVAAAGCRGTSPRSAPTNGNAHLFSGMGSHHRTITTTSPKAQRYFDQGLTWAYAFNHDEAIRSFEEALQHDPRCAMCYWGIALCHGPHINNPVVPPDRAKAAWDAVQQASAATSGATPAERALIDALEHRYSPLPDQDRAALDRAYAENMQRVWTQFHDDPDVGTLYAEAMMDLRPWNLWTHEGEPQPGTPEILSTLERVLRIDPDHPGANHLYIHTVEASPHPELANASADRLRDMVPVSGHLIHMPSHIDVLTGRWELASEQNVRAIKADRKYRKISPKQDFYRVYMAHNHHMLAFASMMQGQERTAVQAATELVEAVPEVFARQQPLLADPFMGARYDALKRFGKWEQLLAEPAPPDYLPITTAMWHFHRALAYAALGRVSEAEQEKAVFQSAAAKIPPEAVMMLNPAKNILQIAEHMLNGEIAFRRGDIDASVSELRKGIEVEDNLLYMEPPEWIQPVRHTLGAILLDARRYEEAEKTYREDLKAWPGNGWSLYGLSRALAGQGKTQEAKQAEADFRQAWKHADIPIASSCLCVPKT
jgi:tetratricopeptide (TPR) repeat protein